MPLPASDPSIIRQLGMFTIVISSFVGASGAGVGLGWLLWKKVGLPWWVIVITSLLGLYGACVQVVRYQRILLKAEKGSKE
jgi:F0F1-type ATP synthase assembly protein I